MNNIETVLVIDDNEEIISLLSDILKHEYNILTATNVEEAKLILTLYNLKINCAITDIEMPKESGLELIKYMTMRYPEIPVSIISGSKSRDHAITAIKCGAIDYIDKPFNDTKISHVVQSLIEINKRNLMELSIINKLDNNSHNKLVYAKKMKTMFRLDRE